MDIRQRVGDVWEYPALTQTPGMRTSYPHYQPMGAFEMWLSDLMRNPGALLQPYGLNLNRPPVPQTPVLPPQQIAAPVNNLTPLEAYEEYVNQRKREQIIREMSGGE